MKKLASVFFVLLFTKNITAQSVDYRSAEDGINQLLSHPEFIEDIVNLGTSDLSAAKFDQYLSKYVPEYNSFKIENTAIDFSKIYYANVEGVSVDNLAGVFGKALNLNNTQTQNLKNVFSGNLNPASGNAYSADLASQLYDRGKNPQLDYAIDMGVDFFQGKFGDGGITSSLIDLGGGLMGNLISELNKREQEKMEEYLRLERMSIDQQVFETGILQEAEGNIYSGVKLVDKTNPERKDLQIHYKARKSMPGNTGVMVENVDYSKAINLLNEAIDQYKKNPDRSYYLYLAYVDRALCKMQLGAYRAAIIDYYFAQKILDGILSGKLPDNSIELIFPKGFFDASNKATYQKGKLDQKVGTLSYSDLVNVILNRAFAKYRAADYSGAISDAKLASGLSESKQIGAEYQLNGYKDISKAIEAMAEFKQGRHNASFDLFSKARLNDDLIKDSDNDGITDFTDRYDSGNMQNPQARKESGNILYYGFPNYFPFDIIQMKGLSLYKAGKLSEAIGVYENIVASESSAYYKTFTKAGGDISAVLASLASFYYSKSNFSRAISLLDKAISLDPARLEYYFKRGSYKKSNGQESEAQADFDIVKNPSLLKGKISEKQSVDYYLTAYEKALSANDKNAVFSAIRDAISAYPDQDDFFNYSIKYLNNSQNAAHADELSEKYKSVNPARYHILKSLAFSFSSDEQKEKEEMIKAFENGAGFYLMSLALHPEQRILLQQKPYYCELLKKYISRTNNSFIPKQFDRAKQERYLDSLYEALNEQYSANKAMAGILEKQKREQKAKFLGDFEEYLKVLESQKMLLEMSPIHAFDYVEILFILGRGEDAVSFAQKTVQKGKLMKSNEADPNSRFSNTYYYGLQNIAGGNCR